MPKQLYAIKVYPKKNGELPIRLHFDSYTAAAEVVHEAKKEGFEVSGLNDYPISLYDQKTTMEALRAINVWMKS